jgi:hypothetical protein
LRALAQDRCKFAEVVEQSSEDLSAELRHLRKKHVAALFWTAYSWGGIINLQQREPSSLIELPKVDLMMQRVLELDESFFFGGAHLFYGIYYGGRPEMLGGDPLKAKKHLERAIEINNGKYLMAEFLLARYYYISVQNREMFEHILQSIILASPDLFPEQRLANELARRRAQHWLRRASELFF